MGRKGRRRDAEKHRDRYDTHDPERGGGVLRLRLPKSLHSIRNGLDTGQSRRSGGESPEDQEEPNDCHLRLEIRPWRITVGHTPSRHLAKPTTSMVPTVATNR